MPEENKTINMCDILMTSVHLCFVLGRRKIQLGGNEMLYSSLVFSLSLFSGKFSLFSELLGCKMHNSERILQP